MLSRNTGLLLTIQHCPLIRSTAPVLGQDAGMDIDAAAGGNVQHLLGQDPAIGYNCTDIWLQVPQLLHRFLLPEMFRLENGQVIGKGHFLYGRIDHLHAPALGTVRLGVDTDDFKTVGNDFLQAGRRDVRRSHEYNSQKYPSG